MGGLRSVRQSLRPFGRGAVSRPQFRYLLLAVFLALASRSAWSLYSPCGPSGRGWTLTQTCGLGLLSNGGSVCLEASNPNAVNSLIIESASARLDGSIVL